MRAVWSGAIGLGMINIPIKLYLAVGKTPIKLSRLSRCCVSQVGNKYYCKGCEREIDYNDWDKGFEIAKGEFVKITQEQIEAVKIPSEESIDLFSFVPVETINPIWRSGDSYYIGIGESKGKKNKVGRKAYTLLKQVLDLKGLAGIGKLCQRGKESLVMVDSYKKGLLLTKLYFAEQIREDEGVFFEGVEITPEEEKLGLELVEQLENRFKYEEHRDGYIESLQRIIEGEPITEVVESKKEVHEESIVALLKQSVEAKATA
jgi:DNA end-binding protein Ku